MTDNAVALDKFLASAQSILQETEGKLFSLANEALAQSEAWAFKPDNGQTQAEVDTGQRLQQVSQQLSKLSARTTDLQRYLQNGLDTPPVDDKQWPRIRILQSHEEERAQLARDLEDTMGQLLANAVFELASVQHLLLHDTKAVADGLTALQQELEQGLADIRYAIANLEPATILGNFGLGGGVRRYLEQYEAHTQIKTHLNINTNLGRLPTIIEVAIFRVIQEALQNVNGHANATEVEVTIEEKDAGLEFRILDNGDGLSTDRIDMARKNLGLARMVDYAALLNGKLKMRSTKGQGTQVILSIPHQSL